jgi:hypothetical protein
MSDSAHPRFEEGFPREKSASSVVSANCRDTPKRDAELQARAGNAIEGLSCLNFFAVSVHDLRSRRCWLAAPRGMKWQT